MSLNLDDLHITFFNEIIFDTPQLFQFISRTPTLRALEKGCIAFNYDAVMVKFPLQTSDYKALRVDIPCTASGWQRFQPLSRSAPCTSASRLHVRRPLHT